LNPVSIATGSVNVENGNKEVILKIKIHSGYHIYAEVSERDPFIATVVDIEIVSGNYGFAGELKKPSFRPSYTTGTTIYTDEVMFSREITGNGEGEVKITIFYQCCDSHICFPPEERIFTLKLK
jgi:DsbC/DsbD-like thiol-disulfide interchange protein